MRDPKRIPKVLKELEEIWTKFPDLRLGQLLLNAVADPTLYYTEDEDLLKELKDLYINHIIKD